MGAVRNLRRTDEQARPQEEGSQEELGEPRQAPQLVVALEIRAELVASVFKVLARQGQPVGAGEPVVILESMKMEIPVLAERAGIVADVRVHEGDVVHEGDLLVTVDD